VIGPSSSTGSLIIDLAIGYIVDPDRAQELAQVLLASSTGIALAYSTGIAP
jgi:hypothetical protein